MFVVGCLSCPIPEHCKFRYWERVRFRTETADAEVPRSVQHRIFKCYKISNLKQQANVLRTWLIASPSCLPGMIPQMPSTRACLLQHHTASHTVRNGATGQEHQICEQSKQTDLWVESKHLQKSRILHQNHLHSCLLQLAMCWN